MPQYHASFDKPFDLEIEYQCKLRDSIASFENITGENESPRAFLLQQLKTLLSASIKRARRLDGSLHTERLYSNERLSIIQRHEDSLSLQMRENYHGCEALVIRDAQIKFTRKIKEPCGAK